ncbi:MAG: sigma-54 dependent transcriptional regulator [Bacteroidales bacterium]
MKKILIIDDDSYICNLLVNYLQQKEFKAEGTISGLKGIRLIEKENFDLILCDYRLPDSDGLKILQHVKSRNPSLPVIIMTAYADVKMAVKLIKAGAFDYVTKPIHPDEILQIVNRAIESGNKNETDISFEKGFIVGSSPEIKKVMQHVKVVAPTDLTILIEGETGSGKEVIARAIHYSSNRKNKPFVAVDCGAIPKELANSELFGHIKGAFTGAINDKKGYFEIAKGGTLFLDEVGNLPYENQIKLLRALQERIISKVGDNKIIKTDVRLIAATNDDLLKQLEENEFREDLYHRLNGFKIQIPALRDRAEDIMEFTEFFIKKANKAFNKNVTGLDDITKKLFFQYQWFGNIRELQNIINRAVLLSQNDYITSDVLPDEIRLNSFQTGSKKMQSFLHNKLLTDLKEATEITEKEVISNALIESNYNKSKAAKILNIDRKTLYNKIKLYEIEVMK